MIPPDTPNPASFLNTRGIQVIPGSCSFSTAHECLSSINQSIADKLLLPGPNPPPDRHFLNYLFTFSTLPTSPEAKLQSLEAFYKKHKPSSNQNKSLTRPQLSKLIAQKSWGDILSILQAKYGTTPDEPQAKSTHQSDFRPPPSPPVNALLRAVLSGPAGSVLLSALGPSAVLTECTSISSEPGAPEQMLHSDSTWGVNEPRQGKPPTLPFSLQIPNLT